MTGMEPRLPRFHTSQGNTQANNLLMSIDGEVRELPIDSRGEN
jgi:hypothetical protein